MACICCSVFRSCIYPFSRRVYRADPFAAMAGNHDLRTRLSRAQTTMNRSDSPDLRPICAAPISLLCIPRHSSRRCRGLPSFTSISYCMPRSRTPAVAFTCCSGFILVPHSFIGNSRPLRISLMIFGNVHALDHRIPSLISKLNCFRGMRFPLRPAIFPAYA